MYSKGSMYYCLCVAEILAQVSGPFSLTAYKYQMIENVEMANFGLGKSTFLSCVCVCVCVQLC